MVGHLQKIEKGAGKKRGFPEEATAESWKGRHGCTRSGWMAFSLCKAEPKIVLRRTHRG